MKEQAADQRAIPVSRDARRAKGFAAVTVNVG